MSEQTSIGNLQPVGVVELGTASKETRGSLGVIGLFDGGLIWPFMIIYNL